MTLRTGEDTLIWRRRLWIALCGGIVLEEVLDLSSDRILNEWLICDLCVINLLFPLFTVQKWIICGGVHYLLRGLFLLHCHYHCSSGTSGTQSERVGWTLTGVSVASCVRRERFRFLCRSTSNDLRIIRLTSFSRLNGCLILPRWWRKTRYNTRP